MAVKDETVRAWSTQEGVPSDEEFFAALTGTDGRFDLEEGQFWDFKDAWPFSLSDDYFFGISRLICAFANMSGGVIVFGVHDKLRTGGHNKVEINFDKFRQALSGLI